MEQPTILSSSSKPPPSPPPKKGNLDTDTNTHRQQQRPPTPEELVTIYESRGLNQKEASLKAIADLQAVLYRTVLSTRGKKDGFMGDTMRKLDNVNTRLAILEAKLDAKPGYPETLAIGVASGAALHALPHVLGAIGNMWNAVKSAVRGS